MNDNTAFNAWYEADYWLFGLIYHILFLGKELNDSLVFMNQYNRRIRLEEAINKRIANDKRDPTFTKNANRLGYIRERLVESCKIFESYVH